MRASLRIAAVVAFTCVPAVAWAQTTTPGIRNTKHDLSSSSAGGAVINPNSNQICIYCHTPHMAPATAFAWNHAPSGNTSWSWGQDQNGNPMTATFNGTPLPFTLLSASKRCLGCHDGSVALGSVANEGSGVAGTIAGLTSLGNYTNAAGQLSDVTKRIGFNGSMGGIHPVSIPYPGQSGYNGANSRVPASEMNAVGGYFPATTAGCGSPSGVCTAAAGDGRLGANINLIPAATGTLANMGVECTSCHEPHNKYGNQWFTRVDNTNASGLCRSCHNK